MHTDINGKQTAKKKQEKRKAKIKNKEAPAC